MLAKAVNRCTSILVEAVDSVFVGSDLCDQFDFFSNLFRAGS